MTDFNYSEMASKEEMIIIAKALVAAIISCNASLETKLMVAPKSVNTKLGCKAALSALSSSE